MNRLYISMYHYVRDLSHSRYPEIKGMTVEAFKQQLDFFEANFNIVTMEDVIDAVNTKNPLPDNALLLTFDDGYADHFDYVFPILNNRGHQGSFFIPGKTFTDHKLLDVNKIHYILASADMTELYKDVLDLMNFYRGKEFDYPDNRELLEQYEVASRLDPKEVIFVKRMLQTVLPEKVRGIISSDLFEKYVGISEEKLAYELYLTEDQIENMHKNGMFIGLHGYDHYWLGNLDTEQMKQDISLAKDALDKYIDSKNWVMNYPYGSCNDEVIKYIKSEGATLGMITKVDIADLDRDNRFMLPRLDCIDFPPRSENYKNYN